LVARIFGVFDIDNDGQWSWLDWNHFRAALGQPPARSGKEFLQQLGGDRGGAPGGAQGQGLVSAEGLLGEEALARVYAAAAPGKLTRDAAILLDGDARFGLSLAPTHDAAADDGTAPPDPTAATEVPLALETAPAPGATAAARPYAPGSLALGSPPPLGALVAHGKRLGVPSLAARHATTTNGGGGCSSSGSIAVAWAEVPHPVQELVAQSLQAPLPAGWSLQLDLPNGRFVNQWSGQAQKHHPLDDFYREKVQETLQALKETTSQQPPQETLSQLQLSRQDAPQDCTSEGAAAAAAVAAADAVAAAVKAVTEELAVARFHVAELAAELKVAQQAIADLQRQRSQERARQGEQISLAHGSISSSKQRRLSALGTFWAALRGRRNEKIAPN
jgi:hypothetical protein